MASRLQNLIMSELSGVDAGANEIDGFMVMKSLSPERREQVLELALELEAQYQALHKAMGGTDMTNAPEEVVAACKTLLDYLESMLGEDTDEGADSQQMPGAEKAGDKPYGDVEYADPGYQSDKQKRYPLDTETHIRAAWGYINQAKNKDMYSADDYTKVRNKVKAAMKKIGADVAEKSFKERVHDFLFGAPDPDELAELTEVEVRKLLASSLLKQDVVWGPENKSFNDLREDVQEALCDAFPGGYMGDSVWVNDLTADKALVCSYRGDDSTYWVVPFTMSGDEVTLAPMNEWVSVEQAWVTSAEAA